MDDLWSSKSAQICDDIGSSYGYVKIVLKTKNEEHLLRTWIDHHLRIAGPNNVIIMDNGSESSTVLSLYGEYKHKVKKYTYLGIHNYLHVVEEFSALYAALRRSCKYYIFLDTDEFLYFKVGEQLLSDPNSVEVVLDRTDRLHPGVWLPNYPGCSDMFFIADYPGRIIEGLTWGKPLVPSSSHITGYINHNIQLISGNADLSAEPGLFVGHLTRLFPEQRIKQNIQKLLARKIIKSPDDVWDLLDTKQTYSDENANLYLREIANLRNLVQWDRPRTLPRGCLQILEDGQLSFGDAQSRDTFINLDREFQSHWKDVKIATNRQ